MQAGPELLYREQGTQIRSLGLGGHWGRQLREGEVLLEGVLPDKQEQARCRRGQLRAQSLGQREQLMET